MLATALEYTHNYAVGQCLQDLMWLVSVQSIIMELNILLKVVIISPSLQLTGVLVVVAGVATYRIRVKFGGDKKLTVWRSDLEPPIIMSANYFNLGVGADHSSW